MKNTQLIQSRLRHFTVLLVCAAAWNIAGAALVLINLPEHIRLFFGPDAILDNRIAMINTVGFWGQVILFGIGYLIVAINPLKNHAVIALAIAGKIAVFFMWTWCWVQGYLTVVALFGGVGDLLFAGLLAWFLIHVRRDMQVE